MDSQKNKLIIAWLSAQLSLITQWNFVSGHKIFLKGVLKFTRMPCGLGHGFAAWEKKFLWLVDSLLNGLCLTSGRQPPKYFALIEFSLLSYLVSSIYQLY